MDIDSTVALVMALCLGVGLIAAIVGVFLFNGFRWWDDWKL